MEFNFSPVKKNQDTIKNKTDESIENYQKLNEDKMNHMQDSIMGKVNYLIDNTNDELGNIIRYLNFNHFKENLMNRISIFETNLILYILCILLNSYNVRILNPKHNLLIWVYVITIIPIISFTYLVYQNIKIESLQYYKSESNIEYITVLENISDTYDKCKYVLYLNIFTIPVVFILMMISIFK